MRPHRPALRVAAALLTGILLGLCVGLAQAAQDVAFEPLDADKCLAFSQLVPSRLDGDKKIELPFELVIEDAGEYRKILDPKLRNADCDEAALKTVTDVDFSTRSVLGLWTSGSCGESFKKAVLRDDLNKTIIYAVTIVPGPLPVCMRSVVHSLNLVAIPKIPLGYRVLFEKIEG